MTIAHGTILGGLSTVPDLEQALRGYRDVLQLELVEQGKLSEGLAASWGAPGNTGSPYAVLRPASGEPCWFRLVEQPDHPDFTPTRTYGWAAYELTVKDVFGWPERLDGSGYPLGIKGGEIPPLARLIDDHWGVVTGSMTTIHCYTGSQPTVDAPAADYPRSRAAALSMVPTTTSAQRLLDRVLPQIAGRIEGSAVRVPTASVSAVDLAVMTERPTTAAEVNQALRAAGGVIGATDRPLVSTDLRARPESIVMATPETRVTAGGMLRVFGWYDNEWGFSNRMLDVALRMGGR